MPFGNQVKPRAYMYFSRLSRLGYDVVSRVNSRRGDGRADRARIRPRVEPEPDDAGMGWYPVGALNVRLIERDDCQRVLVRGGPLGSVVLRCADQVDPVVRGSGNKAVAVRVAAGPMMAVGI